MNTYGTVIQSMLDDDQYKFSMQAAILELFPNAIAHYRFINRGKQRFNEEFLKELRDQINCFSTVIVTDDELNWYRKACPFLKPWYFDYLKQQHH